MNKFVFLLPLVLLLSACGQKGPLYLPASYKAPAANATPTIPSKNQGIDATSTISKAPEPAHVAQG